MLSALEARLTHEELVDLGCQLESAGARGPRDPTGMLSPPAGEPGFQADSPVLWMEGGTHFRATQHELDFFDSSIAARVEGVIDTFLVAVPAVIALAVLLSAVVAGVVALVCAPLVALVVSISKLRPLAVKAIQRSRKLDLDAAAAALTQLPIAES